MKLCRVLRYLLLEHPVGRRRRIRTLLRFAVWQIRIRLNPGPHQIGFIAGTRLLVGRGMTGATGNVYVGLHEFVHMAFALHVLRSDDLFIDVGANVGSYTVLAAGAANAHCIALEPVSSSFAALQANLRINQLEHRVRAIHAAAGARCSSVQITTSAGPMNQVTSGVQESRRVERVPVVTLDSILNDCPPLLMKIDVEGWETEVVRGAHAALSSGSRLAVIMELNGSGRLHGFDDDVLHQTMIGYGFDTAVYDPFSRLLVSASGARNSVGNTLYVSSVRAFQERTVSAPRYEVLGLII